MFFWSHARHEWRLCSETQLPVTPIVAVNNKSNSYAILSQLTPMRLIAMSVRIKAWTTPSCRFRSGEFCNSVWVYNKGAGRASSCTRSTTLEYRTVKNSETTVPGTRYLLHSRDPKLPGTTWWSNLTPESCGYLLTLHSRTQKKRDDKQMVYESKVAMTYKPCRQWSERKTGCYW